MIEAALVTLDRLTDRGWATVAGDPPGGARGRSAGYDAATERTEAFDPFGTTLGKRD
jgi:hypothetical protein